MEKYFSYGGVIESKKFCGNIEIRFTPKCRKLLEVILECEPSKIYLETITSAIVNEIQDVIHKHLTILPSKDTVDSINDISTEYARSGKVTLDIPIPFSNTKVFLYKYTDPFKSYFKDIEEKDNENISIQDIISFKEKMYKLSDDRTYAAIAASPFATADNIATLSYPSYPQPYPHPQPLSKGLESD